MKSAAFSSIFGLFVVVACNFGQNLLFPSSAIAAGAKLPNIVVIFTDDRMGFVGSTSRRQGVDL